MFLIDLDSPGIEVRPTRASSDRNEFAETFFDDVFVPGDRVVGEVDAGWGIAMTLLQWERGMYAWQRQAVLHARLAEVRLHPGTRSRAEARAIADAWVRVTALRSAAARTVRRLAAGENPGPEISVDKVLLATTEQAVEDLFRLLDPAGFVLGDAERDASAPRRLVLRPHGHHLRRRDRDPAVDHRRARPPPPRPGRHDDLRRGRAAADGRRAVRNGNRVAVPPPAGRARLG